MRKNEFELTFHDFVSGFGGEVLTETSDSKIADYLFRKHNIVAELKCLMEDQTATMNEKVTLAVRDWWRKGGKIPAGYDSSKPLEIATAPKGIADRWLDILKHDSNPSALVTTRSGSKSLGRCGVDRCTYPACFG